MKEELHSIWEQWGQDVSCEESGETWKAFVQPVRQKNRNEDRAVTPLGDVDWRRWLYLGPGERSLWEGATLLCGGERYTVRERTVEYLGSVILYERAILVKAKEAAV